MKTFSKHYMALILAIIGIPICYGSIYLFLLFPNDTIAYFLGIWVASTAWSLFALIALKTGHFFYESNPFVSRNHLIGLLFIPAIWYILPSSYWSSTFVNGKNTGTFDLVKLKDYLSEPFFTITVFIAALALPLFIWNWRSICKKPH